MGNFQILVPRNPPEKNKEFIRINAIDNGDGTHSLYFEERPDSNTKTAPAQITPTGSPLQAGSIASGVTGLGTDGYLPIWVDGVLRTLGDSFIFQEDNGIKAEIAGDITWQTIGTFRGGDSDDSGNGTLFTVNDGALNINLRCLGTVVIGDTTADAGNGTKILIDDISEAISLFADLGATLNGNPIATGLSGTYTPAITEVANLVASEVSPCQYMRVGDTVTVSGKAYLNPVAAATPTMLGIALPIASNFVDDSNCAGIAFAPQIAGQGAAILGDAVNNRAQLEWISGDINEQIMFFTYTYQIIP